MVSRFKVILFICISLIFLWMGWNTYSYFFSTSLPSLSIDSIENDGYFSGDISCIVKGRDDYKVSCISIYVDGKPYIVNYKVNKKEFDCPFTIPTKSLSNGKHALKVDIQNSTYNKAKQSKEISFNIDNLPLQAAFVKNDIDAKVLQGRTLHMQFQVNKEIKQAKVRALSKVYNCFPESANSLIYECFIPIECEEIPNEYLLTLEITDKVGNNLTLDSKFQVLKFDFKRQNLRLDPAKVKVESETGLSEKQLEAELEQALLKSPNYKLWQGTFCTPIEIKDPKQITTDFGVIRVTQERGLRQHKAIDMCGGHKCVVWAPQDGIVIIKNRYAHSGNTVVIDHGCGIFSLIFHLDSFASIEVGDKIKKGNPVGIQGATGFAKGDHVHQELRVNNVAVDPTQWSKHDF